MVALSVAGMPTAVAEGSWTMPDLSGMSLPEAQAAYDAAIKDTGGPWLDVINQYGRGFSVRAPKLYEVCKQAPDAGDPIDLTTYTAVAVNRSGEC
ncbi:hypothetical protein [Mycobacterium sp. C31M]